MKLNSKYQTNCYDNIAISRKQLKLHLEKKSIEAQNEFKLLMNSIYYKDSLCFSMDISTDNVDHISYIGLIMYYVSGAEEAIWNKESMMIGFSTFCENHTTVNINRWFLEMLNNIILIIIIIIIIIQ